MFRGSLVEINASDGDIGFHFLMDGDDLTGARIRDPKGKVIFEDQAKGALKQQKLIEIFAESAEPPCFNLALDDDPENEGEDCVTLLQFLDRWRAGTYRFIGKSKGRGVSRGESEQGCGEAHRPAVGRPLACVASGDLSGS